MKKVIISFVVLVAAVLSTNAQIFVGGGVGVDFGGGKSTSGGTSVDLPKSLAFSFTPKVGFYLNDDFAVGLEVGLLSMTQKRTLYSGDERKDNTTGWAVGAFARYNLIGGDKLSLLLEGSIAYGGMKDKTTVGSTTTNGDPVSTFGIGVLPVLSYSLTEKLSIEASCDFLRLGFLSITEKDSGNSNDKVTENYFGFGVNPIGFNILDIDETLGISNMFKVGLTFKF